MTATIEIEWPRAGRDWRQPRLVRAFLTTRKPPPGGRAPFNLSFKVCRSAAQTAATRANRRALRALLPQEPRWLSQAHGACVVRADSVVDDAAPAADAAWTKSTGVVCAATVADCLPVFFSLPKRGRGRARRLARTRGRGFGKHRASVARKRARRNRRPCRRWRRARALRSRGGCQKRARRRRLRRLFRARYTCRFRQRRAEVFRRSQIDRGAAVARGRNRSGFDLAARHARRDRIDFFGAARGARKKRRRRADGRDYFFAVIFAAAPLSIALASPLSRRSEYKPLAVIMAIPTQTIGCGK